LRAARQQVGELRLQDAEFVAPRVAKDPEVVAVLLLVVPASGAEGLGALNLRLLGLDLSRNGRIHAWSRIVESGG
jgi:hypothetical protein